MQQSTRPLPEALEQVRHQQFLSLRWRLLAGFTLVFTLVFAGAYYWFYAFSTTKTMNRLKQELKSTAEGIAAGINAEELLQLYQEGERNGAGFSDDPRYQNQLAWFQTVRQIEARVYPYTYRVGLAAEQRRVGAAAVAPTEMEIVYLVDSLWLYNPEKALRFLQSDVPGPLSIKVMQTGETHYRDLYTDAWGSWISAYTPVRNAQGEIVAILGADIEADYVLEVQAAIRDRIGLAFGVTYGTLLVLVAVVSTVLTRRLNRLTAYAERLGQGDYGQDLAPLTQGGWQDEISKLAGVFQGMAVQLTEAIRTLERRSRELAIAKDALQAMIDVVPGPISWITSDGVYLGVNQSLAAEWQMSPDDFTGREVGFLQGTNQLTQFLYQFATNEEIAASQIIDVEIQGQRRSYLMSVQKYDGGTAIVSVGIEMTERRRAMEALRIAEEKYRSIYENALEGIFQSNHDGQFLSVNPAMAHLYGYDSPEEMVASIDNITEQLYVDPSDRIAFMQQLLVCGEAQNLEYRSYRKDGSIMWVEENTRVVRDDCDNILYFEGIVKNITERKRLEDELKRQLEELRIEIDHQKKAQDVAQITESSYFQELQQEIDQLNLDEFWSK